MRSSDPVADLEAAMTASAALLFKAVRVLDLLFAAVVVVAFS
ncbi:MAG: hypothetical protein ACXU82_04795 [Caulobacteraceae bacterium]